jgi:hypothetical protein
MSCVRKLWCCRTQSRSRGELWFSGGGVREWTWRRRKKGEWRRRQEEVGELGLQVWWIFRSRRSWRIHWCDHGGIKRRWDGLYGGWRPHKEDRQQYL